jgi:hypothetical protein
MQAINKFCPDCPNSKIHESSPINRGASARIMKFAKNYTAMQFFPGQEFGSTINGVRNEDLENQTFENKVFD